jgi:hypothetical protein
MLGFDAAQYTLPLPFPRQLAFSRNWNECLKLPSVLPSIRSFVRSFVALSLARAAMAMSANVLQVFGLLFCVYERLNVR